MVPNKIFLLGAISNGAQQLSNIWNYPAALTMSKKLELENSKLSRGPSPLILQHSLSHGHK